MFSPSLISFIFLIVSFVLSSIAELFQFGDIITQSRFEPVLRAKSQLRPCPRDVHPWTRGSQFSAAHPDARKYFFKRFFDVFDRGQRTAAKVVYLVWQRRRVHNQSDAVSEILGINEIDTFIDIELHRLTCYRVPDRGLHGDPRPAGNRIITINTCEPQQGQLKLVFRRIGLQYMLAAELRSIVDAAPAVEG